MKHAWLALLAALLVTMPADAAPRGAASGVAWRPWDRGLREAAEKGRPVLVDVYTDWCGWCRRMEADVYSRPEIRDYLSRNFVTIKLDAEASDPARYEGRAHTGRTLAARFGVTGYPTTVFLKSTGERPISVPGYVDAERFMLVLRYVGEGAMDSGETFDDFVKRTAPDAEHP